MWNLSRLFVCLLIFIIASPCPAQKLLKSQDIAVEKVNEHYYKIYEIGGNRIGSASTIAEGYRFQGRVGSKNYQMGNFLRDGRVILYSPSGPYGLGINTFVRIGYANDLREAYSMLNNEICRILSSSQTESFSENNTNSNSKKGPISIVPRDPNNTSFNDWKIWIDGDLLSNIPFNGYISYGIHTIEIGYGPEENKFVYKTVEVDVSEYNEVIYVD